MVAMNPRALKPSEVARLLNSTPLGPVIDERQLYRHRNQAGFRIGDGKHIDLFRYIAWLIETKHAPKVKVDPAEAYAAMKAAAAQRNRIKAEAGRDIGELPSVADPARKAHSTRDFRYFCEVYFNRTFHLPWSEDHLKVIAKVEQAVLHGGLFAMAMPRGSGKALALDTPLPTPTGWTTMGNVQAGDILFDERGRQCKVTFATEVQTERPCYRVTFSDGESIVCDTDHLWTVHDRYARKNPVTLPTAEMARRFLLPDSRGRLAHRYRLPMTQPLQIADQRLPIEPYALGVWLGDGTSSNAGLTVHANEVDEFSFHLACCAEELHVYQKQPTGLGRRCLMRTPTHLPLQLSFQTRLRLLGVLDNKHIPDQYLRASEKQRRSLLQGLMDTDGHIARNGACEITLKHRALADGLCEILASLGLKYHRTERHIHLNGRRLGPYTRISFHPSIYDQPFRLRRKSKRLRVRGGSHSLAEGRHIIDIVPVPSVPVRCIQVDSHNSLYLAGKRMVPTHNTSIAECACLWAVLYGHRDFVCLIGASEVHALEMLESIKTELESNDILAADFPEVCHPIASLGGITNRCNGQLYNGERTHIGWTANEVVLPTIGGSAASGAIIKVTGITGRIRGMKFKRPDGKAVRPSLVVLDDPQTDESARSLSQCATRERILAGAVLGLAGPGKKIAGVMPCTVIRPGDVADNLLDKQKHPEWNGERTKMVYHFPVNEKLWTKYAEIRAESLRAHGDLRDATAFYEANRALLDEGAQIAWPQRFNHDETSAIQHAMNLKLQDEAAFFAEYQNEPLPEKTIDEGMLSADQIAAKVNGHKRGEVPIGCSHLTMFIDVQGKLLYYLVAAWTDDFTGSVVDYGAYPDPKRAYFTLRDTQKSLQSVVKGSGLEGAIYAGLEALTALHLRREWLRDDGAAMRIGQCLIDANWGTSTDVIYQFCRSSPHAAILLPSHARFVGASSRPFSEYAKRPGDRVGLNWRIPNVQGKRAVRHVLFDTNFWKTFVHARLSVPMGDKGCVSLFGREPDVHRLLADHLTAEYRVRTEGRGRIVDEWKLRPENFDNHWLDCLAGTAVAASMLGAVLPGTDARQIARKRIKLSDFQRK